MSTIMQERIALVAGGAGFVGSHLCARLLELGYGKVLCLDNLSTGDLANIRTLLDNPRLQFLHGDVSEKFELEGEVSEIYNLACPASPKHYTKDPVNTFTTSIAGSQRLLRLANYHGARILLASTSEVYGDPLVPVQKETYWGNVNPYGVRSCYDEGKRGAETLFHDYHEKYGVDTRIIRIFNTYGPNMGADDGRVVSNFIVQALRGEPLTIYGDGSQTRSFQYVGDLVDGIILAMQDGVPSAPINIGNPEETTILELGKSIIRMTGSKSVITHLPLPQDDPHRRCPDISRAKKYLNGWSPRTGLEAGLEQTIAYFRSILS